MKKLNLADIFIIWSVLTLITYLCDYNPSMSYFVVSIAIMIVWVIFNHKKTIVETNETDAKGNKTTNRTTTWEF